MQLQNGRVAMIGAGLMGHGLALVHAAGGCSVKITDLSAEKLASGMGLIESALGTMVEADALAADEVPAILGRITPVASLAETVADADLIVEAVVENAEVKRQVFTEIDAAAPSDAVVASNTSHLDVFPLIPDARQRRCLITHWYTPPYIIDLVDLAPGPQTEPEVMSAAQALYDGMGKKPVRFEKFIPGYVANRLQAAMGLEITLLLDEGWASAEAIDDSIKYGLALRMALMGALMKADFTGLDMMRRAMANGMYTPPVPTGRSATLEGLIAEGKQGVMNGGGYFDYGDMRPEDLFRNRDIGLLKLKATVDQVETEVPLKP
ncbi:MAG: 3-hydroxyacyl-CoA dehydrogenase family protein [Alphaproteobacteria bacterium]|nr:3-hydroxyacyl-CoA dehydrogenase family protein [Alphaproteobacteria bacterium]